VDTSRTGIISAQQENPKVTVDIELSKVWGGAVEIPTESA